MIDEKKLILKLKQRHEEALEQAIEIYTPYLNMILFNMVGIQLAVEDTEEIIADTFVVLWTNAHNIDLKKGSMRSYIAAVARNFALKKLNGQIDCDNIEDVIVPDERNSIDRNIFNEFLWKSVAQLGETDNEIFVRYYKYNEKLKDIANATGLNLSTVKTRLLRGKRKLKIILQKQEEFI